MAAVLGASSPVRFNLSWLWVAVGLVVMYAPSYWDAAHGLWQSDDFGHGPIIVAVLAWLFWNKRAEIAAAPVERSGTLGWLLLSVGLFLYLIGRVFSASSLEFGSHLFVVPAVLLLLRGPTAVRVAWFPIFYLVFLAPLPASFVDLITGPLKSWISHIVVDLLYAAGYPIGRTGVMINIGPYQLLVADACSGLHSMFSLSALGTLYMYLMARKSWLHNAVMIASILPIAFAANIIRVIVLVLVTYHMGDEAGQGFLHGAAGMVLMVAALMFFFLLDSFLLLVIKSRADNRN
ncbi:exosortase B [Aquabacterium sp. J223]|uniref:exosortase B n=1 Tax=Aquabacterium sp. J223 TaxID=2898431 RepID=UPI0021ADDD8E|nr:exosortase B [Aquabacterium sp. J223]UUX96849.1 exosortase B [Aquabacterium sp. J223]